MEQEIKISDLAKVWNVSVNTTWTRIKKEGLITFKKMDNNREITFVTISEDILNKYLVNNVNKGVNNPYYEEVLSDDNPSQPLASADIIEKVVNFSNDVQERLITLNNQHNEEVNNLQEELMKYKEKIPLLEDKANREGLYLKEINELKNVNNRNNKRYLITLITLVITFVLTLSITFVYFVSHPKTVTQEKQITKVITVENGKVKSILTK